MTVSTDGLVKLHDGASANGRGQIVRVEGGFGSVAVVQVPTIDSGQINFEGTLDGHNWDLVRAENLATGAFVTSATASGIYRVELTGLGGFSAPLTGYTSGSVDVNFRHQT